MSDRTNEQQRAVLSGQRVARTNHTVRTASFAYCFLVIGLVLLERNADSLALGAWVAMLGFPT